MGAVADESRVSLLLADYAAADGAGKVNALGLGWGLAGVNPQTGMTPPQAVVAMLDSPPSLYGEAFSVTLTLYGEGDRPVEVPGPSGQLGALRLTHQARIDEPRFAPGANVPRNVVWAHTQVILNLANGIRLAPGHLYTWRLEIDATQDPKWAVSFYVPAAPGAPVFGGPANPASIPGIDPM